MGNLGDYALGNQQFDQILSRLMEQAANGAGAPPASKEAVSKLKTCKISSKEKEEKASCSVCTDEYEVEEEVREMPCGHKFHKDCLDPWLKLRNSCPVCRFELPTDDKNYEKRRKKKSGESAENSPQSGNRNDNMEDDEDFNDQGFPSRRNNGGGGNNYYI